MATPLGDRIRSLRERRNLTQGQLATYARVKRPWLSLVESGKRRDPKRSMVDRVAEALDVPTEYLLYGELPAASGDDPEKAAILQRLARQPSDLLRQAEDFIVYLTARAHQIVTASGGRQGVADQKAQYEHDEERRADQAGTHQ